MKRILTPEEKKTILNQHKGGRHIVNENFQKLLTHKLGSVNPLISEQNAIDFLETSYVKPLVDAGYTQVQEINLPDGEYRKEGGGYRIDLMGSGDVTQNNMSTGYSIVTNSGIRGVWGGQAVTLSGKKLGGVDVYKIFFKESGYKAPEAPKATITINESTLSSAGIPANIVQANAPIVKPTAGKGTFQINGSNDLYGFDFSKTLPSLNGKYYLLTETSEYLNKTVPNLKSKVGTQFVAFVNQTMSGTAIYIDEKGTVVSSQATFK